MAQMRHWTLGVAATMPRNAATALVDKKSMLMTMSRPGLPPQPRWRQGASAEVLALATAETVRTTQTQMGG